MHLERSEKKGHPPQYPAKALKTLFASRGLSTFRTLLSIASSNSTTRMTPAPSIFGCFSMKPAGYYSVQWTEYRKRRNTSLFFFFVFPLCWLYLTTNFLHIDLPKRDFFNYIQVLPCVLMVVVTRLRWYYWSCPGCKRPFHSSLFYVNVYRNRCLHCSLPKWNLPESDTDTECLAARTL